MPLRDLGHNCRFWSSLSYQIWNCNPSQNVTSGNKRQNWFFFPCAMCYHPLCGSIQFLQGFLMRRKKLIYESTLKPPSLLRFWLNIIWYDTSILKNRVSAYYGLSLATLAAHSFQAVQNALRFYFLCISGKCESSIWYTAIYSLSNKSHQIRS